MEYDFNTEDTLWEKMKERSFPLWFQTQLIPLISMPKPDFFPFLNNPLVQDKKKLEKYTESGKFLRIKIDYQKILNKNSVKRSKIAVALASRGIEHLSSIAEKVLVFVPNSWLFGKSYPNHSWMKLPDNIFLGGILNLSGDIKIDSLIVYSAMSSYLLFGDYFYDAYEDAGFDLLFKENLTQVMHIAGGWVLSAWNRSLVFYRDNRERLDTLYNRRFIRAGVSRVALSIRQREGDWITDSIEDNLINYGVIDRFTHAVHKLGWDNSLRKWDRNYGDYISGDDLLLQLEKEEPCFAVESNFYSKEGSPHIYGGFVSPYFVLQRAGIPFHSFMADPFWAVFSCSIVIFMERLSGNSHIHHYSPTKAVNSPFIMNNYFPLDFILKNNPNEKSKDINFSKDITNENFKGFFIATLIRKTAILQNKDMMSILLGLMVTQEIILDEIDYYLFLFMAVDILERIHVEVNKFSIRMCLMDYIQAMGAVDNLLLGVLSLVKLRIIHDSEKICAELGIPFRLYSEVDYRCDRSDSSYGGFVSKEELSSLGKSGWGRISPNGSFPPWFLYHDIIDALKDGYICLGAYNQWSSLVHDSTGLEHEGPYVGFPFLFTTSEAMRSRVVNAARNPLHIFNAMRESAIMAPDIRQNSRKISTAALERTMKNPDRKFSNDWGFSTRMPTSFFLLEPSKLEQVEALFKEYFSWKPGLDGLMAFIDKYDKGGKVDREFYEIVYVFIDSI